MNAPEKIYLDPSDRAGEEYDAEWSVIPGVEGGVEYTSTDAFIEKVCEWLSDVLKNSCFINNDVGEREINAIIEDFKEKMKE